MGRKKYCSRGCLYKYRKRPSGLNYKIVANNKGWFLLGHKRGIGRIVSEATREKMRIFRIGKHYSKKTEFKKGQTENEKNSKWKGDEVGYAALHSWVKRKRGRASVCEFCGSTKWMVWANKSHEYKRDLDDWLELCSKCHRKYDSGEFWGKASKLFPEIQISSPRKSCVRSFAEVEAS